MVKLTKARSSECTLHCNEFLSYILSALPFPAHEPENHIIGGQDAPRGLFNFQLSVRHQSRYVRPLRGLFYSIQNMFFNFIFIFSHICNGALISRLRGLTTAACYYSRYSNYSAYEYDVSAGFPHREGQQIRGLKEFIVYPEYSSSTRTGDIAILVLLNAFDLDLYVSVIKLPIHGLEIPDIGHTPFLSGWGSVDGSPRNGTERLRYTKVKLMGTKKCSSMYNWNIFDSQLCAGSKGNGFCYGDLGAPLVLNQELVGLASWSVTCATDRFPGVYTRVDRFIPWIKSNLGKPWP